MSSLQMPQGICSSPVYGVDKKGHDVDFRLISAMGWHGADAVLGVMGRRDSSRQAWKLRVITEGSCFFVKFDYNVCSSLCSYIFLTALKTPNVFYLSINRYIYLCISGFTH